jgi:hypothetical protein
MCEGGRLAAVRNAERGLLAKRHVYLLVVAVERTDSRRLVCLKEFRSPHECPRWDCGAVLGNDGRQAGKHSGAKDPTSDIVEFIGSQTTNSIVHGLVPLIIGFAMKSRTRKRTPTYPLRV